MSVFRLKHIKYLAADNILETKVSLEEQIRSDIDT